jgi:hypothetical protein
MFRTDGALPVTFSTCSTTQRVVPQ